MGDNRAELRYVGGMRARFQVVSSLVVGSALLAGCGAGANVSADGLALRRVVVYRNGVGYYERAGHVADDQVRFRMRASEVGDFLATLAVIERGGSSVRSASFPLHTDEDDDATEPAPPSPMPGMPCPPPPAPRKPRDADPLRTVVLELDGKAHDLEVGYISATPVWRPSYRLVIGKDGADLQGWGIVQNLSGEDWHDVSLSLVAGAPLAFESTLGTPVVPERPTVTDSGEVISAVPHAETTLEQRASAPMAPPPPSPAAEAPAMAEAMDASAAVAGPPGKAMLKRAMPRPGAAGGGLGGVGMAMGAMPAGAPPPRPSPMVAPSAPRNLSALAAVAVEGGATRYDLPHSVTVPDKSATMVLLVSKHVPGEAIFLFAPDGGVPASQSHPFRVARFQNQTGGLLERGPIAVFEQGAFLGQGMVDPLPLAATATVPFALERSLAVESERSFGEEGARVAHVEALQLVIERDASSRAKYRVKNGGDTLAKLLVKHLRAPGTRLFEPPKGTEENVGTGSALVPVEVAPNATAELVVDERQAITRPVDWLTPLADEAVRAYFGDKRAEPTAAAALKAAWEVRTALVAAVEERKKLGDEQRELEGANDETRKNLKTLEKNKGAGDLRDRLTQRLAKNATRLDEITRRVVELDLQINERRVRFQDLLRGVRISKPLTPA